MKRLPLFALLLGALSPLLACAADVQLPRPPELEPAVQFWIHVYSQITTNEGFIHDQQDLSVVYETLRFDADTPPREREHRVDAERARLSDILQRLGRGAAPATDEERRVRALWGDATPARLLQAADDVRFQLGQADRFRAGLKRAGAWEAHIGEVLANRGLPSELAALPHVESSFDPTAYSKVGAAGLWQFMRSTGRRFLRIDSAVDERLDPFRETEAAAQLLAYNYRLLGTWPLAITAYNHGAEGMRRARDQLGTDDIVRVVHDYHSPTFGFASRNFYVSFLAALTIAQSPEQYFDHLERGNEQSFQEVRLQSAASIAALTHTLAVDRDTLHSLNPALRPPVWSGRRDVPGGYVLRLPAGASQWTTELLAARLRSPHATLVAAATPPGDTQASAGAKAAEPPTKAPPIARTAETPTGVAPGTPAIDRGGSTAPANSVWPAASPSIPTVAANLPYYVVQGGDTLDAIAARIGMSASQLMALNSIRDQDDLYEGEQLRLTAAQPAPETETTPATSELAQAAVRESHEEEVAVAAANSADANTEPVSAAQAQAEGPQLISGAVGPQTADPVDYSVAADGTIRVVAAETLGHYADWLGITAARLRTLNHLRGRTPVVMGRRLKLEFGAVSREQFEQRRSDYHQRLQAAFFAAHRITGTEVYVARRGDSLWNITQHSAKVPIWLLQQYNPDLDFGDLRPGTQISLPKVEDVTGT